MKVVVVDVLAQRLGHRAVSLVGVHDSGENVLLAAHDLHGGFVGVGVEAFCKLVAAVVVEVRGVHVKDQLAEFHGVWFEAAGRDNFFALKLIEHFGIARGRSLKVYVHCCALGYYVLIRVSRFLALIVLLYLRHVAGSFQVVVADNGAVNAVISCH